MIQLKHIKLILKWNISTCATDSHVKYASFEIAQFYLVKYFSISDYRKGTVSPNYVRYHITDIAHI